MVPAATRTTSANDRKTGNSALSAGPPSAPDTPFHDVPPSTLTIMLSRTEGRPSACGRSAYTSSGSTASTPSGKSIRIATLRNHGGGLGNSRETREAFHTYESEGSPCSSRQGAEKTEVAAAVRSESGPAPYT